MENNNILSKLGDIDFAQMLKKIRSDCAETCFNRVETQKNQCGFGKNGFCCNVCCMGPCRITQKESEGVCGADTDTIVARNFLREAAADTSARCCHGRDLVLKLKHAADGKEGRYSIKNEKALLYNAKLYGIETGNRGINAIALDLANLFLSEFSSQEDTLKTLELAPKKRQGIWEAKGIKPNGIDRMVVESMCLSSIGVDLDYKNLLMHAFRTSLSNGWGGSRIASIVSDILFGTPSGLSVDAVKYMLGGKYRASIRPLNEAIIQNRILGVAGITGCTNIKQKTGEYINTLTEELIKRNILILQTECAGIGAAKAQRITAETALKIAGAGLREVCEAFGIPPILQMGTCEDNTKILEMMTEIIKEGGLGGDIGTLPAVCIAAECMSEKAISSGCCFVASGVDVFLCNPFYTSGCEKVNNYLHGGAAEDFNACFHYYDDPLKAAQCIAGIIGKAREALGINKTQERRLFDMKDRRDL